MASDDELRGKLTKALPDSLQPVGAGLRDPWTGELDGYGRIILDALMPVVREALAAAWDDGCWHTGSAKDNPWRGDD